MISLRVKKNEEQQVSGSGTRRLSLTILARGTGRHGLTATSVSADTGASQGKFSGREALGGAAVGLLGYYLVSHSEPHRSHSDGTQWRRQKIGAWSQAWAKGKELHGPHQLAGLSIDRYRVLQHDNSIS
jgi:hypothetical protein